MFKLRNLIKFRNNPKITNKIISNLEISKEDKKTLMEDLKSIETGGGNVEDNLSKVEKAFILDYSKNYDDWFNTFASFTDFSSCIVISDVMSANNKYVPFENLRRNYGAIGFTVSALTCNDDVNFNTIKDFMIEVPVEDFYNLSNNHRVYFVNRNLSYQEQIEYLVQIINNKFPNLKDEEEIILNGYIFLIPVKNFDDWGFITAFKKTSQGYMIKFIINAQNYDEFRYIDKLFD